MDGVIVDTNPFHKQAWMEYARELGHEIDEAWMHTHVFGRINKEALAALLGYEPSPEEVARHTRNKETRFLQAFGPHMSLVPGLREVLNWAKEQDIPMAVATSAPRMNVDFIIDGLNLRPYFSIIVDDEMVNKGKPDPEIYLKTAELLQTDPADYLVFEDSFSGVAAALAAGMKVIAVSTTHQPEEFSGVEGVIRDFSEFRQEAWLDL